MNRRARLPGADELFRGTGGQAPASSSGGSDRSNGGADRSANGGGDRSANGNRAGATRGRGFDDGDTGGFGEAAEVGDEPVRRSGSAYDSAAVGGRADDRPTVRGGRTRRAIPDARPTGRERHDEKITVYCSPEELLQIEHARLDLRGSHGLAVDRGRIVREAIAVVLADLEAKGDASILVRRLRGR
jgi:hypothetical protein